MDTSSPNLMVIVFMNKAVWDEEGMTNKNPARLDSDGVLMTRSRLDGNGLTDSIEF